MKLTPESFQQLSVDLFEKTEYMHIVLSMPIAWPVMAC